MRLFLVGEKHGKNKVQFIREGHIRVQPNSRLVILGGCTLFANDPSQTNGAPEQSI